MKLKLSKPICFFDLETTGLNIATSRIVEICIVKLFPNGKKTSSTWKINPEIHITDEVAAIHGISNEDVAMSPTFKEVAPLIVELFKDSDIAGHNSNRYDIPLLVEEMLRNKIEFDISNAKFIDTQIIYHANVKRRLTDAYKLYTGKELINAHSAKADVDATAEVLFGQLDAYPELGDTVESIINYQEKCKPNRNIDLAGCFVYDENKKPLFNFGKYKNSNAHDILKNNQSYYKWMMNSDFTLDTKNTLTKIYTEANQKVLAEWKI